MCTVDVHAHGVPEPLVELLATGDGRLGATAVRDGTGVRVGVGDADPGRVAISAPTMPRSPTARRSSSAAAAGDCSGRVASGRKRPG